jgi:hypothetical protein
VPDSTALPSNVTHAGLVAVPRPEPLSLPFPIRRPRPLSVALPEAVVPAV